VEDDFAGHLLNNEVIIVIIFCSKG